MASICIDTITKKAYKSGDSMVITIPKRWQALIGIIDDNGNEDLDVTVDLMIGKHGHFIAAYGNHQKKKVL